MKKLKFVGLTAILSICFILSGIKVKPDSDIATKFYSPSKGIYIVDVNTNKCPDCIIPYLSDSLETVESVGKKTNSFASINAGFFDPSNSMTTSYITINGKLVADPTLNKHLTENPSLQPYLPTIFDRSEFRILNCENNNRLFDITNHNNMPQQGCKIIDSVQAGPELVPDFNLEKEGFVVKKNAKIIKESAGALGKFPRSAIAIKGEHILLIAVSNKAPMTLKELTEYVQSLKVDKAMAFDGGSSTSLYVNLSNKSKFVINSAKNDSARRVKSFILVSKVAEPKPNSH